MSASLSLLRGASARIRSLLADSFRDDDITEESACDTAPAAEAEPAVIPAGEGDAQAPQEGAAVRRGLGGDLLAALPARSGGEAGGSGGQEGRDGDLVDLARAQAAEQSGSDMVTAHGPARQQPERFEWGTPYPHGIAVYPAQDSPARWYSRAWHALMEWPPVYRAESWAYAICGWLLDGFRWLAARSSRLAHTLPGLRPARAQPVGLATARGPACECAIRNEVATVTFAQCEVHGRGRLDALMRESAEATARRGADLSDRCSNPPEVSCSDAWCPVHGDAVIGCGLPPGATCWDMACEVHGPDVCADCPTADWCRVRGCQGPGALDQAPAQHAACDAHGTDHARFARGCLDCPACHPPDSLDLLATEHATMLAAVLPEADAVALEPLPAESAKAARRRSWRARRAPRWPLPAGTSPLADALRRLRGFRLPRRERTEPVRPPRPAGKHRATPQPRQRKPSRDEAAAALSAPSAPLVTGLPQRIGSPWDSGVWLIPAPLLLERAEMSGRRGCGTAVLRPTLLALNA